MKENRYNIEDDVQGLTPWRRKVHDVIFGVDTLSGKTFDIALLVAILLSVLTVMLESVREIRERHGPFLDGAEWVFTVLFSIEYIARIMTVGHPWRYIFSFMGIIDLLSVLPGYLSLFVTGTETLLVIRSIRLLRVFRILKLYRYMAGARSLVDGLYASRHKIAVFLVSVLMLTILMGTVMYLVEHGQHGFTSIPRSIYWAIVTLTTVGYGDIAPYTVLGQVIASFIMLLGYAIIAVPTGIVSAEMVKRDRKAEATAGQTQSCPHCKATELKADAHFCRHCGTRLPGWES